MQFAVDHLYPRDREWIRACQSQQALFESRSFARGQRASHSPEGDVGLKVPTGLETQRAARAYHVSRKASNGFRVQKPDPGDAGTAPVRKGTAAREMRHETRVPGHDGSDGACERTPSALIDFAEKEERGVDVLVTNPANAGDLLAERCDVARQGDATRFVRGDGQEEAHAAASTRGRHG